MIVFDGVCVDHDAVGVAVDYFEAEFLDEVFGVGEDLATLVGDEGGEVFGEEARVAEAEAAVHAVGGQLQRHLPDVVLYAEVGCNARIAHQFFYLGFSKQTTCAKLLASQRFTECQVIFNAGSKDLNIVQVCLLLPDST